jgi:hypothetical protein
MSQSWTAGTWAAPLLFGHLDKRPKFDDETDEAARVSLTLTESSPWELRVAPAPGTLPVVGAGVPDFANYKLLAAAPDFANVADASEEDVLEETIGFLREEQRLVYAGQPRMTLTYDYTGMSRAAVADVERLWADRLGVVRLFLAPTWVAAMRLAADVPAGAETLSVEPTRYTAPDWATRQGQPLLALLTAGGVTPARVTQVDGHTLHLAAPLPAAAQAGQTTLATLLLARFADTKLEWSYTTDTLAKTQIKLVEVPNEYASGAIDLPVPAFCYKFTLALTEQQFYRFTSHERPLTISGDGTYAPAPFAHAGGGVTARLDKDTLTLTSWLFEGNPLAMFFPLELEKPLQIEVREVAADGDAAPALIYTGEISKVEFDGKKLKATAVSLSAMFERKFPRFFVQGTCNYTIFSPPCKLLAEHHKLTVQVAGVSADGLTVSVIPAPTGGLAANDYAMGWFVTGSGAALQWRGILASTAAGAGQTFALTLNRAVRGLAAEHALDLYPGCDGTAENCKKLNNYANFGGHPFVPNTNPTLSALPKSDSGGGKKG